VKSGSYILGLEERRLNVRSKPRDHAMYRDGTNRDVIGICHFFCPEAGSTLFQIKPHPHSFPPACFGSRLHNDLIIRDRGVKLGE
jgi:hypothetical protein